MKVTAPGKILLLGGFAVLEHHPGLSIALLDKDSMGASATGTKGALRIISKEFGIDRELRAETPLAAINSATGGERIAVCAYATALAYLSEKGIRPEPVAIELENSPIFGAKDEKSGLGSSAASTVALIACALGENGIDINSERETVHRLAQVSHAVATGKVGGGFDIATSAYGTIKYSRYRKGVIRINPESSDEASFRRDVLRIVAGEWPGLSIEPIPAGKFDILAFNIKGAKTSTVCAVRALVKLAEYAPELYSTLLRAQAEGEAVVFRGLAEGDKAGVRGGMHMARAAQRRMSEWVVRVGMMFFDPIEPKELTAIIDEAEKLEGVVAGRCPGAGGYDSVAFLVEKADAKTISAIREIAKGKGLSLEHIDARISRDGYRAL
ncbi:MAG: hypothetical protein AB1529_02760 [Candidatus Micrarchaeota archaeon]